MRFCPFCSAENEDAATACAACNRRLPPLPPRRRKNGLEQTAPIPAATPEDVAEAKAARETAAPKAPEAPLLGPKPKSLADLAPSPAASRRVAEPEPPAPAGMADRRGRRRTMPPVPSRAERDRIAGLSKGVAPDLAREDTPLPLKGQALSSSAGATAPAHVAAPESAAPPAASPAPPADLDAGWGVPAPAKKPEPTEPAAAEEASPPAANGAKASAPADDGWPAPERPPSAPTPPLRAKGGGDGWPAPDRKPAPHPDDWGAPASPPEPSEASAPEPSGTENSSEDAAASVSPSDGANPEAKNSSDAPSQADEASKARPAVIAQDRPVAVSEPFRAPDVAPVPTVPEAGLLPALKYTLSFARARWQRRGAIGALREQIRKDTGTLDGILGSLGRQTRALGIENKALEAENAAIDSAEARRKTAEHACSEISNRKAEENSKFADSETDKLSKVSDAERALDIAQTELGSLEGRRRELRDQRKTIETRQRGYLKAADARDSESEKAEEREQRERLRASATALRQDAEALNEERKELERDYDAMEEPISKMSSRVDALKSDRDAAKRSLTDLREGHRHRIAELDAEEGRKSRELAQAEAEIERRFVTLGTLVNLNRIDRHEFASMYEQIDTLRGAIGARSNEIDKLSAERQAFDKASLIRGACVLGGAVLIFLALLAILLTAT